MVVTLDPSPQARARPARSTSTVSSGAHPGQLSRSTSATSATAAPPPTSSATPAGPTRGPTEQVDDFRIYGYELTAARGPRPVRRHASTQRRSVSRTPTRPTQDEALDGRRPGRPGQRHRRRGRRPDRDAVHPAGQRRGRRSRTTVRSPTPPTPASPAPTPSPTRPTTAPSSSAATTVTITVEEEPTARRTLPGRGGRRVQHRGAGSRCRWPRPECSATTRTPTVTR